VKHHCEAAKRRARQRMYGNACTATCGVATGMWQVPESLRYRLAVKSTWSISCGVIASLIAARNAEKVLRLLSKWDK
jgi:hypothetical protein